MYKYFRTQRLERPMYSNEQRFGKETVLSDHGSHEIKASLRIRNGPGGKQFRVPVAQIQGRGAR